MALIASAVVAGALVACGGNGDRHIDEYNAVERALNAEDLGELRRLLDAGADPDDGRQGPPLEAAVHLSDPEFARLLITSGADVDRVDDDGWTVLFGAASNGAPETVQLLLDAGADPCRRTMKDWPYDFRGMRPLDVAEERGNDGAARVLRGVTGQCPS